MGIKHIEIENHLVFEHRFTAEFCPGVNVLIGKNGVGKTTLMRAIYSIVGGEQNFFGETLEEKHKRENTNTTTINRDSTKLYFCDNTIIHNTNSIYIPEKDILEHSKGLLTFISQKHTGFSDLYKDVLVAAMDVPTKEQSPMQESIGKKISNIIGGYVEWVPSEGAFYLIKTNGRRIPFEHEASGFKRLGFLGLLLAGGQIKAETMLYWDEPENSLNPELIPILVDILLEFSRNGVQVFVATHSEILASYFAVNRQEEDSVLFTSLYKDGEHIKANTNVRFDLLEPNNLKAEPVKLYEKEIVKGLSING